MNSRLRASAAILSVSLLSTALLCTSASAAPSPSSPEHRAAAATATPTPIPTATHTPTAIVTPTATPTSTPQPTPSATPTARGRCIHEISFNHFQSQSRKSERTWIDQRGAQNFSCLTEIIRNIVALSGVRHDPSRVTQSAGYARYYLWEELLRRVGRDVTADYERNRSYIACSGMWRSPRADRHNGHYMIGGGQVAGSKGQRTPGCSQGRLFLTDQCTLIPAADAAREIRNCPTEVVSIQSEIATPLSLIWSDEYKNQPSTVVNFKLAPNSEAKQWLWRGSSALPLLVYDPEHKGEITSATQLFGSWAFGGKEAKPLTSKVEWKNGYEALATLDSNKDGELEGEELSKLALWFDENRDAVSQPGEVKKLSQVGVKKLFVTGYTTTPEGYYAENGYQRVKSNILEVGATLDWVEKSHQDSTSQSLSLSPSEATKAEVRASSSSSFAGVWGWNLSLPALGSGLLLLDEIDGSIEGATITSANMGGVGRISESVEFQEFSADLESRSKELTFQFPTADGATVSNTARLSADGQELLGKTIVSNSHRSAQGSYEYSWVAKRIE